MYSSRGTFDVGLKDHVGFVEWSINIEQKDGLVGVAG